ncbi:MAG: AAA-like domain-containing protein, partial [Gammaproteobacteria bacterium]|nr:AAA-like domain-containing protein [Gammaproteobacteria bacterium]
MSSSFRSSKFYAVGGPVQPDRPCYVERDVDELLLRRLLEADYCHVMAPRHTGKTSLAAHTAWNLRDRDVRVAVIDLTQLLRNEHDDTSGRWYYSIAYRIVRDLRIKSDMQTWWADHSGLTNQQRLVEFFFEVVLASSENRYVV